VFQEFAIASQEWCRRGICWFRREPHEETSSRIREETLVGHRLQLIMGPWGERTLHTIKVSCCRCLRALLQIKGLRVEGTDRSSLASC
jgi:hypothetical protein